MKTILFKISNQYFVMAFFILYAVWNYTIQALGFNCELPPSIELPIFPNKATKIETKRFKQCGVNYKFLVYKILLLS